MFCKTDSLVRQDIHRTATVVIPGVIKMMVVEINFLKNPWIVFGCNKQHFIYLFDFILHLIYFMTLKKRCHKAKHAFFNLLMAHACIYVILERLSPTLQVPNHFLGALP